MNPILRKTKLAKNINILKARDVFFDSARERYRIYLTTVFIPIIVAVLTYVPIIYLNYRFVESYRDYIIGITSVLCLFIGKLINDKNDNDITISNALREYYDCQVFELEENPLIYSRDILFNDKGEWKKEIIDAWNKKPDIPNGKYEVWYGEILSSDRKMNILAFQMDNVIYTYHIYSEYLKSITKRLYLLYFGVFGILFCSIFVWKTINVFILMMFSIIGAIQLLFEMKSTTEELITKNDNIYKYVSENHVSIKNKLKKSDEVLRLLQDVIAENRNKGLFVPKSVRDVYLLDKENNPYYKQLDHIFEIYFRGTSVNIPERAKDIEVSNGIVEKPTTRLDKVQKRLFKMLVDIDKVLREEKIDYMLDGGTLIGAVRKDGEPVISKKGGKFIFWDDDIDLSISSNDIERFINVIKKKLSNKYEIQYYENDEYYSPRLSNVRVREKNNKSILVEKDSELHEKYRYRGLFIDIYAYSPILNSVFIDKLWRKIFIHSLYKKIRKCETDWKYAGADKRVDNEKKFLNLKEKYLKRVKWYLNNAKNDNYYCYTPNYINDIENPGPYIPKNALYGDKTFAEFEKRKFGIPSDTDAVLKAFYGKEWYISPYKSKKQLIAEYGELAWYSSKVMNVTPLKHYKYIEKI